MLKWNTQETIKFFSTYQKYTSLWDYKNPYYTDKQKRERDFRELVKDLKTEGLLKPGITYKEVKGKIKSLRDAFRQELAKVYLSLKTRASSEEVYKPKLGWYESASFLSDVMSTKAALVNSSSAVTETELNSNDDQESKAEDLFLIHEDEDNELHSFAEFQNSKFNDSALRVSDGSQCLYEQKFKRKRTEMSHSEFEGSDHGFVNSNITLAGTVASEDAFDLFGKYIAAQLRSIPARESILLQQEIQNCITASLLSLCTSQSSQEVKEEVE